MIHDQDFMVRNRTEHMTLGVISDIEDLPGGRSVNQTRAICHFNETSVIIFTTTDIELVSKNATGMLRSSIVEFWAWAPFISVYSVN